MTALDQHFRLADQPGSLGLSCGDTGVWLAGVPLLRRTSAGFAPRPSDEIGALIKRAYGRDMNATALSPGLAVVADALNRGDMARAMIAALHLRLSELTWDGAVRIARADRALTKYDPGQPRDWRGRWTDSDDSGAGVSVATNLRPRAVPPHPAPPAKRRANPSRRARSPSATPQSKREDKREGYTPWGGPSHFYGGRLIFTADEPAGIGDNGPPPEAEMLPEAETPPNAPRVPHGWDIPARTLDGLGYPASRNPTLPDGTPWPRATPDAIRLILKPQRGTTPRMVVFVPNDGVGPLLLGTTTTKEYRMPGGYSGVTFVGSPQATYTLNPRIETAHGHDSATEALRLAATNDFETIYFNRSYSTVTNRMVVSLIRSDVVAVTRPALDLPFVYHPYETLSPGQKLEVREKQLPPVPGIARLRGRKYKRSRRLSPEYCEFIGVRYLCT